MVIAAMILAFLVTMISGPAWDDWRARRRTRKDFPVANVVFLLPSVCDPPDQ